MNTWSPIWSQIVDSSLWEEPYYVRVLFTSMLALKDVDFVVKLDTYKLAKRANMKEQEVIDGLKILCAPDGRRVGPQEHEGRRVEEVEGGWLILNGEKYRAMIKTVAEERKRERNRLWMAKHRAMKAGKNVVEYGAKVEERQ